MENKTSNIELLDKIRQGDEHAFEQLFKRYFERLFLFASNIVKDEILAKDIVQEVYIKFWEKRRSIEPINIEAFLYRLVRNQCISHIRHIKVVSNTQQKFSHLKNTEELYRIDFVRDEPYVVIEKELEEEIARVIEALPLRCREVFVLSRIEGLKYGEIAEKLDLRVKNVEKHISKALTIFREHFEGRIPLALFVLIMKNYL
ncbi:RNA polymerase sigma-70 factor [Carboxylicivirga mesophila]|uniref:RNA polymerase sigma-70 factor n=1 Tax=Carboxylicivirga mesophila TaxID=1166478 RepID=A0ABS5K4T5_9BACT|nr:RNA polymerase sigma-70 factor [Carboxylicivirga mesophila]MBS2210021.1 RNA polymerase sigma-70 factor [Carboxylicivirga mesophila]